MTKRKAKRVPTGLYWIISGLICWLIFQFTSPYQMERIYGQTIFPQIRRVLDALHAWLPFSVLWIVSLVLIARWWIKRGKKPSRRSRLAIWLNRLAIFLGGVVTIFYLLWGFNYKRPGIEDRLQLSAVQPDSVALLDLYYEQMDALILHESARKDTVRSMDHYSGQIRDALEADLEKCGYVAVGRPRIRSFFKGILLRWSTAGFYNPWIGEGYLDPGLHALQKPFILAHEMSHAYGVTDEGEANVYALMSTLSVEDAYIQYCARLTFLRYILADLRYYPVQYQKAMEDLAPHVKADLRAISKQMDRYPDILPAIRNALYSSYLKAQGVKAGLNSYNEIVQHYLALSQSGDHLDLLPD